jgi:hypothetical protein
MLENLFTLYAMLRDDAHLRLVLLLGGGAILWIACSIVTSLRDVFEGYSDYGRNSYRRKRF